MPVTHATELKEVIARMRALGADNHPVLKEASLYSFWGAVCYVAYNGAQDAPVSIHQAKIGKRKKNVWEPYMNWYGAYTLPAYRRQGYASQLYRTVEQLAVDVGCRRVKSLAGSSAGLGLHRSLGHQCWGLTPTGECFVDSPLPGSELHYTPGMKPSQAPGDRMTTAQVNALIKEGLRYDKS